MKLVLIETRAYNFRNISQTHTVLLRQHILFYYIYSKKTAPKPHIFGNPIKGNVRTVTGKSCRIYQN